jgi:hypothetical protein
MRNKSMSDLVDYASVFQIAVWLIFSIKISVRSHWVRNGIEDLISLPLLYLPHLLDQRYTKRTSAAATTNLAVPFATVIVSKHAGYS